MSNLCVLLVCIVRGEEGNSRAVRFARGVAQSPSRGDGAGREMATSLALKVAKRSGRSSSDEREASESSSSEAGITALRSLTGRVGGGGGEEERENAKGSFGDEDGNEGSPGGVWARGGGREGDSDGSWCWDGSCGSDDSERWEFDTFGTGLKNAVIALFFDMLTDVKSSTHGKRMESCQVIFLSSPSKVDDDV